MVDVGSKEFNIGTMTDKEVEDLFQCFYFITEKILKFIAIYYCLKLIESVRKKYRKVL